MRQVRKEQRSWARIRVAQSSAPCGNRWPRCAEACVGGGRADLMWPGFGEHEKSMKSRETLIRLKKVQVDERRRRVGQIEKMISEFERISGDLERDIKIEQDRSGIHDPGHFAYPSYAKAAIQRRDNLKR